MLDILCSKNSVMSTSKHAMRAMCFKNGWKNENLELSIIIYLTEKNGRKKNMGVEKIKTVMILFGMKWKPLIEADDPWFV